MPTYTYVLSGTNQEFTEYTRSIAHSSDIYKQIKSVKDLKGLYGESILLIGSYDEREDFSEIVTQLTLKDFQYKEL